MYTFFKQYMTYSVGITLSRVASLLLLPLYTRFFSSKDYGVLDTLMTITALCQPFLMLGIDSAIQILFFSYKGKSEQDDLVMTSVFLVAGVAGLISTIIMVLSPLVVIKLFGNQNYITELRLLSMDIFFVSMLTLFRDNLRMRQEAFLYNCVAISQLLLVTGLNIYFVAVQQLGIRGFIYGLAIGDAIVMLISGVITLNHHFYFPSWGKTFPLLKIGMPLLPVSAAYWILSSSDRFFLLKYSSLTEIGLYGIANRLAAGIGIFAIAVQLAWRPFALRIQSQPDARTTYASAPLLYLASVGWFGLFFVAGSPIILRMFTTPEYAGAAKLLPLLVLAQVMYGGYYIVSTGIEITKQTQHLTWTILIAAIVNIGLNILLIPLFGASGAAIATVSAYTAATFCVGIISNYLYPLPYDLWQLVRVSIIIFVSYLLVSIGLASTSDYINLFMVCILLACSLLLSFLFRFQLMQILRKISTTF